jgi:hypothetical protein
MSKRVGCVLFLCLLTAGVGAAQSTPGTNPGARDPDVFLDNHRPIKPKKDKPATSRSVTGKVVDESGTPLEGALVTLTNTKSKEKTTFITKNDGRYNFDDLSFTTDYKLEAKYKDQASAARNLSQYDRTASIVRILRIGGDDETDTQKVTSSPKK